jgi:hypothetical protein
MAITFNHNDQVYVKDGKLGVGTNSPQDLLHLSASSPVLRLTNTSDTGKSSIEFWDNQSGTSQSGEIFYEDSGNVFGLQGNANGIIFKASNTFPGSELMRLTSSGNLGIGTTNPGVKLQVGDSGDTSNYLRVRTSTADVYVGSNPSSTHIGVTNGGKILQTLSYPLVVGTTQNQELYLGANDAIIATLVDGKFGIGTTSPAKPLHVSSSNDAPIRVESTDATTGIQFKDSDDDNVLYYVGSGDYFYTTASVGIGTTSPDHKLTVYTDATSGVELVGQDGGNQNSDSSKIIFNGHAQDNGPFIQAINTSAYGIKRLGFFANRTASDYTTLPTESMSITNTGNVGIGTTSPGGRLELNGSGQSWTTAPAIRMWDSYNSKGWLVGNVNNITAGDFYIRTLPGEDTNPGASNSEFTIKHATGNVGIGTTSPGNKLHVSGDVIRVVNSTWSGIEAHNTNGTWESFVGTESGGGGNRYNSASSRHTFYNNSNAVMTINSSGNVGIGTTSPAYKLDVNGNVGIAGDLEFTKVDGVQVKAKESIIITIDSDDNDSSRVFQVKDGGGDILMTVGDTGTLQLPQYTAGYLKSDASGNITVDSDTIEDTLDSVTTRGNTTSNDITVGDITAQGGTFTQAGGGVKILNNGTSGYNANIFFGKSDGTDGYTIGQGVTANDGVFRIYNNGTVSVPLAIADNNDATFAGNVGIGTTSPAEKLDVNGDVALKGTAVFNFDSPTLTIGDIAGTDSVNALKLTTAGDSTTVYLDDGGNVGIGTDSPTANLDVGGSTATLQRFRLGGSNSAGGRLYFEYNGDSSYIDSYGGHGGTERFRDLTIRSRNLLLQGNNGAGIYINTAGYVGIGTTSPSQKLEVSGTIRGEVVNVYGSTNPASTSPYLFSPATGALGIGANGSERMRITSDGNVGIGTTSPDVKFQVQGGPVKAATSDYAAPSTGGAISMFQDSNDYGTIWSVKDYNGGWGNVAISPLGGNVGIGTTSPSDKLVVAGIIKSIGGTNDGKFAQIYVNDSYAYYTTNAGVIYMSTELQVNSGKIGSYDEDLSLETSGTTRITVSNTTGNVGIGTTSPSTKLQVADGGVISFYRSGNDRKGQLYTNSLGTVLESDSIGNDPLFLRSPGTSGMLLFFTSTSEKMRITSGGNVGIGTTSPVSTLTVLGTTTSTITIQSGSALSGLKLFNNSTTDEANIINHYNGPLILGTNNSERVRITGGGNVGIGTTSPPNKLTVYQGGGVRVTGIASGGYIEMSGDLPGYSANQYPVIKSGGTIHFANNNKYSAYIEGTNTYFGILDSTPTTKVLLHTSGNSYLNGGNVGIGTTSPTQKLDVNGDIAVKGASVINRASAALVIGDIAGTDSITNLTLTTAGRNTEVFLDDSGNVGINDTTPSYALDVTGTIRATGDVIAYSDARVKENVETIPNALDKVKAMRGVGYNKIGEEKRSIGVIAQEMLDVIPEVVHTDDQGMHSVAYGNLVGVLIEAMKEQQQQIEELKAIIDNK